MRDDGAVAATNAQLVIGRYCREGLAPGCQFARTDYLPGLRAGLLLGELLLLTVPAPVHTDGISGEQATPT